MKNYLLIVLLVSQAVSLVHIKHLEADKKNKDCTVFYNEPKPEVKKALYVAPQAELLPNIGSFEDALNGKLLDEAPQAELFPEVAQTKNRKRK
jgi:hypothetical protein